MEVVPYETRLRQDRIWARKQIDAFFPEGGPYQTLEDLTPKLEDAGISYVLAGGVALGEHGIDRQTAEVEILVTPRGLAAFWERHEDFGYVPAFPGAKRKFKAAKTGVTVDFFTTGEYPGDGKRKAIAFPDPEQACEQVVGIRVIQRERFIELRLASGRLKDLADIQELIRHAKLPAGHAERLDESVRGEYLRLWRIAQIPDVHNEEPPSSERMS
jgi:hypothetical protein